MAFNAGRLRRRLQPVDCKCRCKRCAVSTHTLQRDLVTVETVHCWSNEHPWLGCASAAHLWQIYIHALARRQWTVSVIIECFDDLPTSQSILTEHAPIVLPQYPMLRTTGDGTDLAKVIYFAELLIAQHLTVGRLTLCFLVPSFQGLRLVSLLFLL